LRRFTAVFSALITLTSLTQPAGAGPTLLFEPSNGKVLYAEDADILWHPASLTKVMTAYLVFEAIKEGRLRLDDKIPFSLVATLQPPSKLGLPVGSELTVETALKAIIIKSANDVTVMLAEAVSGSEAAFVAKMNATAKRLGMSRTVFLNTNGLPERNQVTTARDMAKLARAVVSEYAQYAGFWSMTDMSIGKIKLRSHNALLRSLPGADGLKTGFTCDSGFNIIASASRDGRQLMAVVMGESSGAERNIRAASLLEHGFQTYGWKELFNTASLDGQPDKLPAQTAVSVRHTVTAWSCNPRPAAAKPAKAANKDTKPKPKPAAAPKTAEN